METRNPAAEDRTPAFRGLVWINCGQRLWGYDLGDSCSLGAEIYPHAIGLQCGRGLGGAGDPRTCKLVARRNPDANAGRLAFLVWREPIQVHVLVFVPGVRVRRPWHPKSQ